MSSVPDRPQLRRVFLAVRPWWTTTATIAKAARLPHDRTHEALQELRKVGLVQQSYAKATDAGAVITTLDRARDTDALAGTELWRHTPALTDRMSDIRRRTAHGENDTAPGLRTCAHCASGVERRRVGGRS